MAGKDVALAMVLTMKDKTARSGKSAKKMLGGLAKAAGGLALGGVAAIGGLAVGIGKLATESAKVEQVRGTFEKLAESIGTDGVTAVAGLRDATRGLVSDADLMQAGNKFMAMGLATSAEEANKLAEVATQLGMAMGEDATSSMENFALMMANQSIPRLDSFGISSGKVRERINELMESTEGMTREQAFNMAVMEQAQVTMGKVGEQAGGAAAGQARLAASIANVKDGIGKAFLPIMNLLMDAFSKLAEKYGPLITAWAEKFATILPKIIGLFKALISGDEANAGEWFAEIAGVMGLTFKEIGKLMGGFWKFVDVLGVVRAWLSKNIPIAIEAAKGYFENVLVPAFTMAWEFMTNFIIPAFLTVVGWLAEHIPVAIQAAADFFQNTLKPALEIAWDWIQNKLIPAVTLAYEWLRDNIPVAIEAARAAWEDVLQPALETVWDWVENKLIPAVSDAYDWLQDNIPIAVEAARKAWEDVLQPAIETVWNWLKDLWQYIRDDVIPGFLAFKRDAIDALERGFDGLKKAIQWVKDKAQAFIDTLQDLTGLDLGWLMPGSPTPLEVGLVGIAKAFDTASQGARGFNKDVGSVGNSLKAMGGKHAEGIAAFGESYIQQYLGSVQGIMAGADGAMMKLAGGKPGLDMTDPAIQAGVAAFGQSYMERFMGSFGQGMVPGEGAMRLNRPGMLPLEGGPPDAVTPSTIGPQAQQVVGVITIQIGGETVGLITTDTKQVENVLIDSAALAASKNL